MTTRQPGLRRRLKLEARRIFHQHEQLDVLHAEVVDAVAAAAPGRPSAAARDAMGRLRQGLLAHFEVEERTHFPALHGLSPESDDRLVQLVEEHRDFRTRLERLERVLASSPVEAARSELRALAEGLASHETLEEELFETATKERS